MRNYLEIMTTISRYTPTPVVSVGDKEGQGWDLCWVMRSGVRIWNMWCIPLFFAAFLTINQVRKWTIFSVQQERCWIDGVFICNSQGRDSVLSEDKCLQPASKLSGREGPATRVGADGSEYTVREEEGPWISQTVYVQKDFTFVTWNWKVTFFSTHEVASDLFLKASPWDCASTWDCARTGLFIQWDGIENIIKILIKSLSKISVVAINNMEIIPGKEHTYIFWETYLTPDIIEIQCEKKMKEK